MVFKRKNKAGLTTLVMLVAFLIAMLTLMPACMRTYPGTHQLAIDIAAELNEQVCRVPYRPGDPCGDRNVQSEGKSGMAVYVYIYGVHGQNEMQLLVDSATKLRDKGDKQIPVYVTFYADLTKSHEIKTIEIKGN